MDPDLRLTREIVTRNTLYPQRVRRLRRADAILLCVGVAAVLLGHRAKEAVQPVWEFQALAVSSMVWLTGSVIARYRWSRTRRSFVREHRAAVVISGLWVLGIIAGTILAPTLPDWTGRTISRWGAWVWVSELLLLLRAVAAVMGAVRGAAAGRSNPAMVLVLSFLVVIAIGTVLLMLPRARAAADGQAAEGAPFVTALFTATSAVCVTGLVVVDTPTYWSREGHIVLLVLFQMGGLGIMTFGAFFALTSGRDVQLREHATLSEMLESEGLVSLRRLGAAVIAFTFVTELIGVGLLWGLFDDRPFGEQLSFSVFHSVSGFCNAGFVLTENSVVGMAHRWPVWGGLTLLIIVGGLGFSVLYDVGTYLWNRLQGVLRRGDFPAAMDVATAGKRTSGSRRPPRLMLTSQIVLITSGILLLGGMLGVFLLERTMPGRESTLQMSLADAWFQSVSFRSAGFNTVDIGLMQPASKLLGILLMYIGASPGSTGGGIRTVVFAVAVLGLISVLRGRRHLECMGRTIPEELVHRALAIMFLSGMTILATTLLLVIYEGQSDRLLPYLFEATSAVGTVGLSSSLELADGTRTSVTQSLSPPSQLVVTVAMFLGRIGPLTLLLALTARETTARYEYPEERVTLG